MIRTASRRVIACLFVLGAVALGACSSAPDYAAHNIKGVMPDLAFTLKNAKGETVDAGDYDSALTLLYFGYTHCPDICPTTLARIHAAIGGLDADRRDQVKVLFVSVDPKRDAGQRLARYTANFGPEFTGLTGSQKQLRTMTKRYRVTYGYGKPDDDGFYLVSHSSAVFVFDDQGEARLLANQDETVDQLTRDLSTLLSQQG